MRLGRLIRILSVWRWRQEVRSDHEQPWVLIQEGGRLYRIEVSTDSITWPALKHWRPVEQGDPPIAGDKIIRLSRGEEFRV